LTIPSAALFAKQIKYYREYKIKSKGKYILLTQKHGRNIVSGRHLMIDKETLEYSDNP
jgi:guanyl-specific ribonuclease Sa